MKQLLKVVGLAGILALVLAVRALAAPALPSQSFQTGINTPQVITVTPQVQSTAVYETPPEQGKSFFGGMMGRMGRSMMGGGQMGHMGRNMMNENSAADDWMMTGVAPMHDDVAGYLGMTTQDLYNQMAAGKSMVQLAAEKGITEQQLIDSIMAGRRAAYDQAVTDGYITRAQADAELQNMNSNAKMMVNGQGSGSSGWGMMWDTQPSHQFTPFGMHH